MASVASGAVVHLNGVDLSPYLQKVQYSASADMLDCTSLADTQSRTYQKALLDKAIQGEGFYKASPSVTATDVNGLFNTALADTTSDYLVSVGPDGSTVGSPALFGNVKAARYDVSGTVGELIMSQFEAKASKTSTSENVLLGLYLANATYTTATNGTSYDNAAESTGYAVQVNCVAGDSTVAIQLQSSTNNSVWVNLGSVITLSSNTAVQVLDTSTSVNRYLRAVITPAGATNSVSVVIKIGYTG